MLAFMREGDIVLCQSMDRLGRNLDDLLRSCSRADRARGESTVHKRATAVYGQAFADGELLLSVMGAFAQFERELIRERQQEGIALAMRAGVYRGRKRTLSPERAE